MKKTWSIFCVAALLALSLTGCADKKTGENQAEPSPVATRLSHQTTVHGTAESGDLAGSDGVVGGGRADARPEDSPLGQAGEDVRNTLDKAGDGVRDALDDAGDAARDVGRDAKRMIEDR